MQGPEELHKEATGAELGYSPSFFLLGDVLTAWGMYEFSIAV